MKSFKAVVAFGAETRDPFGEPVLRYHEGEWSLYVNGDLLRISSKGFFRARYFVERLISVDTAAIGGGRCWYAQVSTDFPSEEAAIKAMLGYCLVSVQSPPNE